ncbi:MAG: invasion associated locus B family protein [Pseudomonadota bacterium]
MTKYIKIAAFCLLASLAGPMIGQTAAQEAKKPEAKPQQTRALWAVNCNPVSDGSRLICQMSQTFNEQQSRRRVMAVAIRPNLADAKKPPQMVLSLPHGLDLTRGVTTKIDDADAELVVLMTTDQNGVYSFIDLSEEKLAALQKGNVMTVTMHGRSDNTIALPVSLVGFTAAFKKVMADQ